MPTSERAVPAPRAAVVQLVTPSHSAYAAPAPAPVSQGSQATAAPHHPAPIPAAFPATNTTPLHTAAPVITAAAAQLPNGHAASSEIAEDSPPAAPAGVAAPAPKPAAPAAPPRSWGKVAAAPVSNSSDDSLPTPAEAALALSSDADGPKEGTSSSARRGGQRSGAGAARLPRA